MYNTDFNGFSKNELTFSPINARDNIITSLDGSIVERKIWVSMFANAAVPLIKKEGVKGKQYKKKRTVIFFFFIFCNVPLYLLFSIFVSNLLPPIFLINKNNRKEPMQFPIQE